MAWTETASLSFVARHESAQATAAQGAGSSPDIPFFDRGTWEQATSLGP